MKVLVAYESRSGRTARAANAYAHAATGLRHEALAKPLQEVSDDDLAGADLLLVGSWVDGFIVAGVGPARAASRRIAEFPWLAYKPCGVFCTYAVSPRRTLDKLAALVSERGGWVIAAHAAQRFSPEAGAGDFVRAALDVAQTRIA